MKASSEGNTGAWDDRTPQLDLVARNVMTNYVVMAVEMVIGVLLLPFNIAHLGKSSYGLLILAASVTMYFSMLDLGYGDAQVRFAALYRARRDSKSLNQVVSTLFFVFAGIGLIAFGIAVLIAFHLQNIFNLTPDEAASGKKVLLIVSTYVALGFPFSTFGGIVNGFQRNYSNGIVAVATSVVAAIVNIIVLIAGYGVVEMVAATTTVRIVSYLFYRWNAYRIFPMLRIRLRHFSTERLKEITGFSAFLLIIDLANKINYCTDTLVIGAFLNTAVIATWSVAQRLADTTQRLTGQLNGALFPVVVDNATVGENNRLRIMFLQGTRLSLALVLLFAIGMIVLARPVVLVWVGPQFLDSVPIIYLLAIVVTIRVANSTATTILKGAEGHRLLAYSNISIAVTNLLLSILLVRYYGMIGVALGTLIPLGFVSMFVLFPAACRRVEVSIREALITAVWPAVWPGALTAAFLIIASQFAGPSALLILLEALSAGLLYAGTFLLLAVPRTERRWYLDKAKQVLQRPRLATAQPAAEKVGQI